MVAAVRVHKYGGPEVLTYEDIELPAPGQGQVRVKHHASGVNFIDTYFRSGLYPSPAGLPFVSGNEGAGEVTALGPGVTDLKVGDRVGYVVGLGAYAGERNLAADRAVKLPDSISYEQAAGMMLKGMTVQYLLNRTFKVGKGMNVLVHAAAGGVGLILCQWAKHIGATVIGTVGSLEKAAIARAHGCDHAIVYTATDFAGEVRELTKGAGVPVVYDSVGKATFEGSLNCLARRGVLASYGEASGDPDPIAPRRLGALGSIFLTHPSLGDYTATRAELLATANHLFDMVASRKIRIEISAEYPLADAARAHADMEQRRTTGSIVLIP